jgi:MYXO-CTERM domain-containing protein
MFQLLTAILLAPAPAHACGGFFCNNDTPVDQSAERIVFSVDDDAGTVDTHVQIFYSGAAEEFAWVLPTPTQPELFLSTDRLFTELASRYAPTFQLEWHEEGRCDNGWYSSPLSGGYDFAAESASYDGAGSSVVVVDEARVGPYDTVTLQAESEAALIDWLQEAGYDLPDTLDTALAPYVSFGAYFVALKLAKDEDVGDIAPLGMTYAGNRPMIPITLTSIAATPDMRLETYVFGEHRAVPDNYLHVQVNEAGIDWFSGGTNYEDAITRAADEAGGQAFATDYSGTTDGLDGRLHDADRYDLSHLRTLDDPAQFMDEVMGIFFSEPMLFEVLQDVMPPPAGVDPADFYNCVECYDELLDDYEFSPSAAAAALDERIVEPLRRAQQLSEHTTVTRLTSSISPVEMTSDPMFVFNPDMGDVTNIHTADVYVMCGDSGTWWNSTRRLELADGRIIYVPSEQWFDASGLTYPEFIESLTTYWATIIEDTSASGDPDVLFAATDDPALDAWNTAVSEGGEPSAKGCGCSSGQGGAAGSLALLGLLTLRRRRSSGR